MDPDPVLALGPWRKVRGGGRLRRLREPFSIAIDGDSVLTGLLVRCLRLYGVVGKEGLMELRTAGPNRASLRSGIK